MGNPNHTEDIPKVRLASFRSLPPDPTNVTATVPLPAAPHAASLAGAGAARLSDGTSFQKGLQSGTRKQEPNPLVLPKESKPPSHNRNGHSPDNSSGSGIDVGGEPEHAVRMGRYASEQDAGEALALLKRKWPELGTMYAAPVAINSLRDGRAYYRLQVNTASQEKSETVCRRIKDMDQSCTIMRVDETSAETPY